jgi:hypothetical protein
MKKEILFASYLMLCIIFGACDDENEVNQPPVIDKFEIEVTADGNTVFATIDYAVSDPEKEIESIILKKKCWQKLILRKIFHRIRVHINSIYLETHRTIFS